MVEEKLNLVAIGACGVGKSSFLNYLLREDAFQTSTSVPVTTKGFWGREASIRGFPVNLIDTWGLEAGKEAEWKSLLNEKLSEQANSRDISQCFHAMCYVISATGNRVQDYDLNMMEYLIGRGFSIIVILTKAAKVSDSVLEDMALVIAKKFGDSIPVVPVNSLAETLRDGHRTEPFGVTVVEGYILMSFWQTIQEQIPRIIVQKLLQEVIDRWDNKIVKKLAYSSSDWDLMDAEGTKQKLEYEAESLKNHIRNLSISLRAEEINKAKRMYRSLAECMDKQGSEWKLSGDSNALEASFKSHVSNPTLFARFARAVTFAIYDPAVDIRNSLSRAAKEFSATLKAQIESDLEKEIATSIKLISVDRHKLSAYKTPLKIRFVARLKKYIFGK